MKTLFTTHKYLVAGVVGLAVIVGFGQEPAMAARKAKSKKKVEITNDTIVIHPAVKMSPADAKAMDAVLQKNSKTLYKVDTVENGKVSTQGSLKDANLTAAAKAEAPKEARGGSNKSHQVICPATCNPQQVAPFATVFKPTGLEARRNLIGELKPILEKYQ
jgi:hypothetical protein